MGAMRRSLLTDLGTSFWGIRRERADEWLLPLVVGPARDEDGDDQQGDRQHPQPGREANHSLHLYLLPDVGET